MGMMNPPTNPALDKMSETIPEGTPFLLQGIRTVEANSQAYGKGEMVVCRVHGHDNELGIWGSYLLHQAKAVAADDLNKWYRIERKLIPGFGKGGRPVKAFVPAEPPATQTSMAQPTATTEAAPAQVA